MLGIAGGGGGFSNSSSATSTMGPDMSSMAQRQEGDQGVGAVNIGGDAASTLSRPWWMGGAGWQSSSPAAVGPGSVGSGGAPAIAGGDGGLPEWAWWAAGGLGLVAAGAAAFFAFRGG